MIDADRRLGRFTHRAESFLGLGPGDIGRRLAELSLPIHAPDLQSWITRAMEQSTLVEAEVHDRADRWHRLQIRPRRGADGRVDGALLSLVDIDALRHEVLLAQMARDYARSIVEAVQVPLLVLDARLQVLSANAAYFRRFRAPKAATEGRDFFELEHGAWDASGLRRALSQVLGEAGSFRDVEVECRGLGDEPITLSISGSPVTVSASTPFVLVALEDVTERRQVERRRADLLALAEEARQRAERADAAKDQFLGHLSHELRTPLTAILLQAELLRSGRTPPDAVVRAATTIEVCTRRQARLIEDLLDVTRSVAGKLTLASGPVELRALVEEALEPLQTAARAKGVRLLTAPGEPVACLGDPGRLQQVVTNLVGNAIKFTPAEGRVEVAVDSLGGRARLVVQDTGQGMAAAFVPRVFERFAQEGSDPSKNPGLGLGLAIVQDLVRLHGGDVTASSPGPGLGATFIVTLPQGPAPVSAA
jgi:two-component system CheB/CheR fusion protein